VRMLSPRTFGVQLPLLPRQHGPRLLSSSTPSDNVA
jgi:hypothetical protein